MNNKSKLLATSFCSCWTWGSCIKWLLAWVPLFLIAMFVFSFFSCSLPIMLSRDLAWNCISMLAVDESCSQTYSSLRHITNWLQRDVLPSLWIPCHWRRRLHPRRATGFAFSGVSDIYGFCTLLSFSTCNKRLNIGHASNDSGSRWTLVIEKPHRSCGATAECPGAFWFIPSAHMAHGATDRETKGHVCLFFNGHLQLELLNS